MSATKELTNSIIKEKATDALMYRGKCLDMDQCLSPGYYLVESDAANIPEGIYPYGILTVKKASYLTLQEYTPHIFWTDNVYKMAKRTKSQSTWSQWFVIKST